MMEKVTGPRMIQKNQVLRLVVQQLKGVMKKWWNERAKSACWGAQDKEEDLNPLKCLGQTAQGEVILGEKEQTLRANFWGQSKLGNRVKVTTLNVNSGENIQIIVIQAFGNGPWHNNENWNPCQGEKEMMQIEFNFGQVDEDEGWKKLRKFKDKH